MITEIFLHLGESEDISVWESMSDRDPTHSLDIFLYTALIAALRHESSPLYRACDVFYLIAYGRHVSNSSLVIKLWLKPHPDYSANVLFVFFSHTDMITLLQW